jgi:hypothetical protein
MLALHRTCTGSCRSSVSPNPDGSNKRHIPNRPILSDAYVSVNLELMSSSTYALCALSLPSSCSWSRIASTSIGGLKPSVCALFHRFILAIPIDGYEYMSVCIPQTTLRRYLPQTVHPCQTPYTLSHAGSTAPDAPSAPSSDFPSLASIS